MTDTAATLSDVLGGQRQWAVEQADCIAFLKAMEPASVDLVFGSPPYEMARLYLEDGEDKGIARNTEQWVAWMVEVVRASLRVCRGLVAFVVEGQTKGYRYSCGPALLMADLHRAGICLRKPPIYHRIGIPGSGGPDWLRNDWEWVICATNGGKLPWSDNTAMGHPPLWAPGGEMSHRVSDGTKVNQWGGHQRSSSQRTRSGTRQKPGRPSHVFHQPNGQKEQQSYTPPVLANPGNVVSLSVGGGQMGNDLAHENEAPFPEELAEFFVASFCPPGGLCCDLFTGSGTTGAVSVRLGRRFIGCDLRESQVKLARRRIGGVTPPLPGLIAEEGERP